MDLLTPLLSTNLRVYVDNYFTSVALLCDLYVRGILACGTVRSCEYEIAARGHTVQFPWSNRTRHSAAAQGAHNFTQLTGVGTENVTGLPEGHARSRLVEPGYQLLHAKSSIKEVVARVFFMAWWFLSITHMLWQRIKAMHTTDSSGQTSWTF